MQLGQTLWSKNRIKQTMWNRRRARPILIGHIDGSTHRGEAKQTIEPNPAGRSSDIPERNRVTERHITQKQSVRKDEIPRAFFSHALTDTLLRKTGLNSIKIHFVWLFAAWLVH
jgi:hypothetical protein